MGTASVHGFLCHSHLLVPVPILLFCSLLRPLPFHLLLLLPLPSSSSSSSSYPSLPFFLLQVSVKTLPFYTDYFNVPYPLPKIDLIAIPDFAAGSKFQHQLLYSLDHHMNTMKCSSHSYSSDTVSEL